ncbi:hypothetical protein SPSYN_00807 [Sporotomaculum syntrophicum]|uniref:Uncharacterized protein n=1 Tax=Sporotomaculum syntrophicum TaxID=182264 RepID=A0A9D3AZM8_9FIRM|nr:hypothetical protein [Sporotomaculum syntrophicum]KAF1086069.1 hypothetical protein SPSYN_00807 [Sporotomaculum syntrophicum]
MPREKHKKRRKHRRSIKIPRYWWAVVLAVVLCIVAVGLVSFSNTNRFQPISYIPMEHLVALSTSEDTGGGYVFGSPRGSTPPAYGQGEMVADLYEPAPSGLTREGKLLFIQNKYLNLFNRLETAYRQELQRLAQSAWQDYQASRSGNLDISVPALARQYIGAARSLEKQADAEFAGLLAIMKSELMADELPTDLVQQAENEYERQKSETRKEMLKQVASLIND